MAKTITTKDGKVHAILGSTTPLSIVREYCGDEVVQALYGQVEEICCDITDLAARGSISQSVADSIYTKTSAIQDIFI